MSNAPLSVLFHHSVPFKKGRASIIWVGVAKKIGIKTAGKNTKRSKKQNLLPNQKRKRLERNKKQKENEIIRKESVIGLQKLGDNMHVVVTGAAGFLGSHLCDRLIRDGHTVTGLDNFITGRAANISHLNDNPSFRFIKADVSKEIPVTESFDQIFHLASPASPIDYIELPLETMYVNADGTRLALELAEKNNARFFISSTSEVYGDPEVHPQHEEYWGNVNPIGPRSVYDEAKRYAEALATAYQRYKGVEVRIVRIFNTYGPRMRADDGRVIPTFINQALEGKPLTIFGDGTQTRSFCYVDDLIEGFIRLMNSDLRKPCNVGNPHELTMNELATEINNRTQNPIGVIFKPLPKDDPTRRRPDLTRANTELNWSPKIPFSKGIEETITYFRNRLQG